MPIGAPAAPPLLPTVWLEPEVIPQPLPSFSAIARSFSAGPRPSSASECTRPGGSKKRLFPRHFGRFVVVFNGSLSGTRDKPAGI